MSTAQVDDGHGRRRRAPWWLWTVGVAAAVVAVVALLGGFADVPDTKLPVIAEGGTHVGGQLNTTVERIYLSDTKPGATYGASDETQYLVVEATVANTTDLPSVFVGRLLRVVVDDAVEQGDSPSLIEARTGLSLSFAQPGLPVLADFVWEVPRDEIAVGDTVFLGFFEQFPIYGDPVFGDDAFGAPTATARMESSVGPPPVGAAP